MSIDHLETKKNDDRLTLESKYGKDHFEVKKYVINQEKDASRFKKDEDGNYVGPYALMNDSKKYINEMLDKRNRLEIKIGELKEKQSFFGEQLRDLDQKQKIKIQVNQPEWIDKNQSTGNRYQDSPEQKKRSLLSDFDEHRGLDDES